MQMGTMGFRGPRRPLRSANRLRALATGVVRSAGECTGEADEVVSCSRRPLAQLAAFGVGSSLIPAQWSLRKPLRLPHWCSGRRWVLARSCATGPAKHPSCASTKRMWVRSKRTTTRQGCIAGWLGLGEGYCGLRESTDSGWVGEITQLVFLVGPICESQQRARDLAQ